MEKVSLGLFDVLPCSVSYLPGKEGIWVWSRYGAPSLFASICIYHGAKAASKYCLITITLLNEVTTLFSLSSLNSILKISVI